MQALFEDFWYRVKLLLQVAIIKFLKIFRNRNPVYLFDFVDLTPIKRTNVFILLYHDHKRNVSYHLNA